MPTIGYSHRPVALGRRGMVASAHSYATLAGLDVLRSGGTAADAAVAVNAVLGVTQPENCGVGGDIFCLYYEAATGRVHFLDGSGRSGSRASLDELHRRGMDRLPVPGPATVSVPGCVRGWAMLLERFGTKPLAELPQPPTQGLVALLGLNILEGLRLADHRPHSVEHLHLLIEISKLAYADRDRWIGDPAHAKVPVAGLLSKPYAAGRRAEFDPSKAQSYPFGDPRGDTTGFVVADERGNLISVIQSLFNAFGSGVVPPGTGVVLQNRGRHFTTDPAHPAALAPGKRPFHTLMACVATRDARPVLGFATMGGHGQAMFHLQVLTNLFDSGMDILEAN